MCKYSALNEGGLAMTAWGTKVGELLREHKKNAAWLAKQTGIARGTISNWLNNPEGVRPEPDNVGLVAKAFGLKTRDLAPYAGYPVIESKDPNERTRRRLAIIEASPRFGDAVDGIDRLSARDQDTMFSMIETFVGSRKDRSEGSQ
jgi:transcriptional regulator with XRE-family HTH domain